MTIPLLYIIGLLRRYTMRNPVFALVMVAMVLSTTAYTQQPSAYEEILLTLNVQRIGNTELPALIDSREAAYLPVKNLFDYLKIKNYPSQGMDSLTGYYINPQAIYLVDKPNNTITYNNRVFTIAPDDLVLTANNLYLKIDWLTTIFGLDCNFNFRSLSITLTSKVDLPVVREMQQDVMRKNIFKLKGQHKADTTIGRSYNLFRLGAADWSLVNAALPGNINNLRLNLVAGANILGGEASTTLTYNTMPSDGKNQQFFKWRYVNNDARLVKQVVAGNYAASSISTLLGPIAGVQITNTPTTYRRSFGTYTLTNTTEPGWMVELYVNNVLVNYMQADASGFYSFEVPMMYGNTVVLLKFYGPWGEVQSKEEHISIPYNFLPKNQFEYNISAGMVNNSDKEMLSRAMFNYGVNSRLTMGAGVEYLLTASRRATIPFVNASVRVMPGVLFTGEVASGVRNNATLTYKAPSNFQVDVNYTTYAEAQKAILFNFLSEKRIAFSLPMKFKKIASYSRLMLRQSQLFKSKFNTAELLVSALVNGVSTNITTLATVTKGGRVSLYSTMAVNWRMFNHTRVSPQLQYDFTNKRVISYKMEAERPMFKNSFIIASFEKNRLTNVAFTSVGFRFNFSFAQTSVNTRFSNNKASVIQSARGSVVYDNATGFTSFNTLNNVGRGGIILNPFLDVNCNGQRDEGENKVLGINVRLNGGRLQVNKDTTISVIGLEAATNYVLNFDKGNFDNVAWQVKHKSIAVVIDPNRFKIIDIPVKVLGEVSGTVSIKRRVDIFGSGRIIVNILDPNGKLVAKTLTEQDGYFSYLGLAPGNYTVTLDEEQLTKLQLTPTANLRHAFTIKASTEGDIVQDITFTLAENGR